MKDKTDVSPDEAKRALADAAGAEHSALSRVAPTRGFSLLLALLCGGLVFLAAYDLRAYQVLALMGIVISMVNRARTIGIHFDRYPPARLAMVALGLVAAYFILIIGAEVMEPAIGRLASAVIAAGCFASLFLAAGLLERHWLPINGEAR